jgi:DNA (cytosine-5)-methyltransferase 1/tRNA (cytosine38-C5)-methyltransferase
VHRLCPSRFGLPNQRPRVYLVASADPLQERPVPDLPSPALAEFLDAEEDARLYLPEAILAKHRFGLDLVTGEDRRTCCFIGGYGRRFVGGGSFLRTGHGIRRFSPTEVARLLGYPHPVSFPEAMPLEARYKLLGNGLSIPVAAWVVGAFGESGDGRKMGTP